ncbi:hypothetical protein CUMW_033090 [Citrus unshiu]|nr:hypothetical protein CUMW_033090 [Citrus unshiu]
MDGMHHDRGSMPPPNNRGTMMHHHNTMTHMTFFWGKNSEILFSGWPGTSPGMYVLALILVFVLAVLVERLSHCKLMKPGANHATAGLIQTLLHAIRVGLAFFVMLAIMSFNAVCFWWLLLVILLGSRVLVAVQKITSPDVLSISH